MIAGKAYGFKNNSQPLRAGGAEADPGEGYLSSSRRPSENWREAAFCATAKGTLLRNDRWAFIEYGKTAPKPKKGKPLLPAMELYDMKRDSRQYTNLANNPEYAHIIKDLRAKMATEMKAIQDNDPGLNY